MDDRIDIVSHLIGMGTFTSYALTNPPDFIKNARIMLVKPSRVLHGVVWYILDNLCSEIPYALFLEPKHSDYPNVYTKCFNKENPVDPHLIEWISGFFINNPNYIKDYEKPLIRVVPVIEVPLLL